MDAFRTHENIISFYKKYLTSFINIKDDRVNQEVLKSFESEGVIPDPLIQFNPAFQKGESLKDLLQNGEIDNGLLKAFGNYNLYKHQIEALRIGMSGKGFVVTSGTGSGKSLTYLATIFNNIFQKGHTKKKGVKAILVYPMNALINSQAKEIEKYAENFEGNFPITFAKYTGQEGQEYREMVKKEQPDIILTNYMMLELIMTRHTEVWLRDSIKENLEFLVFDELHTYRGRQGSDVSLLIRRIKGWCKLNLVCIGTSATMLSKGTPIEKKKIVANVASTIFGDLYTAEQIVGEYLETCTKGIQFTKEELMESILKGDYTSGGIEEFVNNPITNWLEIEIALQNNDGILERGKPITIKGITHKLQELTNLSFEQIYDSVVNILKWTEKLNEENRLNGSRKSFLPFRFHQFISQTSTVSVTLESRNDRIITIQQGRYVKNKGEDLLLYPLLFSRYSGVDFICVKKSKSKNFLLPRNPIETLDDSDYDGYVVLDEGEDFWNEKSIDIAPVEWLTKDQSRFKPDYEKLIPKAIYFNEKGKYNDEPGEEYPIKGYFIACKLRIDPTAGILYEDSKINESTKLMSIGNEGRSTATTLLSYSVIKSLFEQNESKENQKLLSFTDNRQDASLQAGHFNDFLSTIRLRSALNKVLKLNPTGLDIEKIDQQMIDVLGLDEKAYAKNPSTNPRFIDENNIKALKIYLLYRILQDLKRGWRYTLPNLEQTALLNINYKYLKSLCSYDDEFEKIPFFNIINSDQREEILIHLLNYFRTNFAISHRYLLEDRLSTENILKDYLDDQKLWSLEHKETIDSPTFMVSKRPINRYQRNVYFATMGSRSGFGKYLKRKMLENGFQKMSQDEYKAFIEALCNKLVEANILYKKEALQGDNGDIVGYLLRTDVILWSPGDGETVKIDETRINFYKDFELKPNNFFQDLYNTDFSEYTKEIFGSEHTGQLSSKQRIEREDAFKSGEMSTLFCSPTMELGIDIANLNIVHMRNVPPNPANYAQRSGRAGRSGQTAVVLTYCSAWSPHDQNYFNASETMISGAVIPPRIDLKNEELVTCHFNAFLLMELAIKDLNSSVSDVLDLSNVNNICVKKEILEVIENGILNHKEGWKKSFKKVLSSIGVELNQTKWFDDNWFEDRVNDFDSRFVKSFDRWIILYQSAYKMANKAHMIIIDPTIKADSNERKEARSQQFVSQKQLELLLNNTNQRSNNQSEFYIFRYLASEGFLPGYNFTRLPVRTFVGYKQDSIGEYISRPRSIALKEFGPHNTLYHNGSKYKINRMMVLDAQNLQRNIKLSKDTGYAFLDDEAEITNIDPITSQELKNGTNSEYKTTLIELTESEAVPQERISCVEEERSSAGYEIEEYFRYPEGISSTKKLLIQRENHQLINLIFGQATELIKINRKARRSPKEGFAIDQRNGKWLSLKDLQKEETNQNKRDVHVFVRDTADSLYIQPLSDLGLTSEQTISLSYALKRGIERLFQVEENEIGVSVMGKKENPNILIYEASEGCLGILSQLIQDPIKLKELFIESYRCMHFDPETFEETDLGKTLPKASYQDLLSYYNQRDHEKLNRYEIKEVLEKLINSDLFSVEEKIDRVEQLNLLKLSTNQNNEHNIRFLEYLFENNLSYPDKANLLLENYNIYIDFIYNSENGPTLVFCDSHQFDDINNKYQLLKDDGYDVLILEKSESIEDLITRRKDIFRKIN